MNTVCRPKTLADLGFDRIQTVLAGHCHSDRGRELAAGLEPTSDPGDLELRRGLFAQAKRVAEKAGRPDVQFPDLRDLLEDVARGEPVLEPAYLLELARAEETVRSVAGLRSQCDPEADRDLLDRLEGLIDHSNLISRIGKAIGPDGQVRDDASPLLRRLRNDLIHVRQKIQGDLMQFLRVNPEASQESVVTERNGRFVVPIKADFKGRVEGLVHDFSSSRRTAFMEPTGFIRENNRIQELLGEEREEVVRILRELTTEVRKASPAIQRNGDTLAELDSLFAKVQMAQRQGAELCLIEPEVIRLLGCRHPLLPKEGTVPVDLKMEQPTRLLLISGPNGGGKTVALKTLGLMILMHQSGLALPVEPGSSLSLFQRVAVDIGDPQQLGSDSTYTGHLRTQKELLESAAPGWLVMLDEIGSGTDPEEGGALGTAVMESLVRRGAAVVGTTHLLRIKTFAHTQSWATLAATELDPETHAPTFRLLYGVPGRSSALQIAENLRFPAEVLQQARQRLQSGQLEFEELIRELEAKRKELEEARAKAENEQGLALLAKRQYEHKRSQGFAEGLSDFQAESAALMVKLRELTHRPVGEVGKGEARRVEQQVSSLSARARATARPTRRDAPAAPAKPRDEAIAVGDRVLVVPLGVRGEILELDEKRKVATVQGPKFAVTAAIADLEWISPAEARAQTKRDVSPDDFVSDRTVRMEIDLRGQRVEEGLEMTEQYLSDAALTGFPSVRIIHGMGTGRLRNAIHEMLRKHPLVSSYRDGGEGEGGLGVTVAKLSD